MNTRELVNFDIECMKLFPRKLARKLKGGHSKNTVTGKMQGFGGGGQGFGLSQEFAGYNTMQSGGGFEASQGAGGGFMSSQTGGADGKAVRANRSLVSATVKQLQLASNSDAQDGKFKIDDKEFFQCKIVGQIMQISHQSTNSTYVIDDGTGSIFVKSLLSNDDDVLERNLVEYAYVRVFGKLTEFQGKRMISCFSISRIKDFNELTRHRLEVVYAHLVNTRGSLQSQSSGFGNSQSQSMGMGMGMGMMGNNMMRPGLQPSGFGAPSGFGGSTPAGMNSQSSGLGLGAAAAAQMATMNQHGLSLTPIQNMVYNVFASCKDNSKGITRQEVLNSLSNIPPVQVNSAIEFLTNEGHVFSTIDDDHFSLCM
jgi:replication factor A2